MEDSKTTRVKIIKTDSTFLYDDVVTNLIFQSDWEELSYKDLAVLQEQVRAYNKTFGNKTGRLTVVEDVKFDPNLRDTLDLSVKKFMEKQKKETARKEKLAEEYRKKREEKALERKKKQLEKLKQELEGS